VPACEAALKALPAGAAATLILDLRTPGPPAEFAVAARLLDLFMPAGQPLFSVQKTDDPAPRHFRSTGTPGWTGRLMVLIDADCTNAAETVAAVLQRSLQAPLIGAPTRGRTMQYETAPLTPSHGLRFASAEMRLPDGTSLFRKGLEPVLTVPTDPATKTTVLARQSEHGVKPSITNPERPRHNEAALVAGTAPELPHQLAQSAGRPTPYDSPPLQDRALQVAVDVLTARQAVR
jgi:C-terminal processing protease CtpA/Prc